MQETQVRFLGREDPLEKEMATHSIVLAWRLPWTKEPGGLQSMVLQESDATERLNYHKRRGGSRQLPLLASHGAQDLPSLLES